ncbi:FMN-binding negative transcriptional regulator [Sphingobium subterraneum]|uniref:Transcriptional regulator n=1 Tax=Sphingobium subterraneum TaxID=627688 RepID=A0A841J5S2_9SPHN|nr:FMN-binding negative transcriptional regulator [Sphingobium subterraneum]MBB6123878.1 transcriptional regulator [Sphingobium subterraneum]
MHPDAAFRWDDLASLTDFVSVHSFGMLFASTPEGPRVAHVPVTWLDERRDEMRLGFHLSRNNGLVRHLEGSRALFVANGPHGYVSPDWYNAADQVPTWNYVSVELEGSVSTLPPDDLPLLLDRLSGENEARLAPKPSWTRARMDTEKFTRMLGGIVGYELRVDQWRGTRKLGQNKPVALRTSVADALEAVGNDALAALMREGP